MKRFLSYFLLISLVCTASGVYAATFGTYRQEYEYGLFDGLKFNIFDKKKNEKVIELKEDIDKKIDKSQKSKEEQDKKDDDEYQMYKFMLDNTIAI